MFHRNTLINPPNAQWKYLENGIAKMFHRNSLILCCDRVNRIPVDCHTHNGTKNVFIFKRTIDLDGYMVCEYCNTASINSFDFNSILGRYTGLYDKIDINKHVYYI